MTSKETRLRRIQVYGQPLSDIEPDLLAQLVIMLGRQLAQETAAEAAVPDRPPSENTGEAASA